MGVLAPLVWISGHLLENWTKFLLKKCKMQKKPIGKTIWSGLFTFANIKNSHTETKGFKPTPASNYHVEIRAELC